MSLLKLKKIKTKYTAVFDGSYKHFVLPCKLLNKRDVCYKQFKILLWRL